MRVVFIAALLLLSFTYRGTARADFAALQHRVADDAQAGKPIVVDVHVALCEKTIIDCGTFANPSDPRWRH